MSILSIDCCSLFVSMSTLFEYNFHKLEYSMVTELVKALRIGVNDIDMSLSKKQIYHSLKGYTNNIL